MKNGDLESWIKPLADGSVLVGVVNLGALAPRANVHTADLHLGGTSQESRDLWAHQDLKFTNGDYAKTVPSHGALMLRVSAK